MNVQEHAKAAWLKYSQASFDLDITLTTPDETQTATVKGIGTGITINVETDGQDVIGRNNQITFAESALITANSNYPIRLNGLLNMTGHKVEYANAAGVVGVYQIQNTYPDDTVGMIICNCEDFQE